MALPRLQFQTQVQSNHPFHTFPVFPISFSSNSGFNLNSCRGWSLLWCKTRQVPISPVVAVPLGLSSSLPSTARSACPPSRSLHESLESNVIPKLQDNFNHKDNGSYNNKEKEKKKKKRKPRPSFNDLTMQRWSIHLSSQRDSLPWQTPHSSPPPPPTSLHDLNKKGTRTFKFPNLGDKLEPQNEVAFGEDTTDVTVASSFSSQNQTTSHKEIQADSELPIEVKFGEDTGYVAVVSPFISQNQATSHKEMEVDSRPSQTFSSNRSTHQTQTARFDKTLSDMPTALKGSNLLRDSGSASVTPLAKSIPILSDDSSTNPKVSCVVLPWERERKKDSDADQNQNKFSRKKSNTELAERTIPELELQRLRDAALRMKERIKVGPGGVTEAIVQAIHDKWKEEEVVKLRFEGSPSLNMMRSHQVLEGKTGGIVIWRSGRSVVLYRGMGYEFSCVKSYATSKSVTSNQNQIGNEVVFPEKKPLFVRPNLSCESISATDADIESLLDELGPRYMDWSGRDPIPVDADLLPGRIPGYEPPYRMLPHKARRSLRDAEMTALRQLARSMPPHFALGRNREHQGLAAAIVKLWEKSAIAKIAIKRALPNTSNERMAEEIKKLTGATLLSRNKEYIVLYRGNDFLSPSVRAALVDKQHQVVTRQDDEELSRQKALDSLFSDSRSVKGHSVAGTLTETTEAASKWGNSHHLISEEEREEMRRDLAVSKHVSLVRCLERKLYLAKMKFAKADRALAKVQKALVPAQLPSDLETVTDEERAKFRLIGLKMKAFISLGRREVFDGTVHNIHLNWKHKELIKVIVERKSFAKVKHIAISLEAESGGVLISLDKTTKGYAIILYRGKNYRRPHILRPKSLLTRKQALERSIELQRREALKHYMLELQEKIQTMKAQLEQMRTGGKQVNDTLFSDSEDDIDEEGEEAYLKTYSSEDEDYDNLIEGTL
ncbi:CRS1 / YhbY (CRM) domain-containing protein [Rhynchospora pubera]|uniref:CRS1 / YhbY (CRM) domain-containing protein n=1 Tax=Rhynchospora pubera TaxID=906938 RepID=A0AAV8EVC2_9POAL|nr:CRS1 / YhbY (CRM) domain-containing protein [Rhynchospora pubera]